MRLSDLYAEYMLYQRAMEYRRYFKALQTVCKRQARLLNFFVGVPAFTLATTIYLADAGSIWGQLSLIFLTVVAHYCAQLAYGSTEGTDLEVKGELDRAVRRGIKSSVFSPKKIISKAYVAYFGFLTLGVTVILSGI